MGVCNCYEFVAPCILELEYIDCDGSTEYIVIQTGETYKICAQLVPFFDCVESQPDVFDLGECVDGECPPTPTLTPTPTPTLTPTPTPTLTPTPTITSITTTTTTTQQPIPIQPRNECDVLTIFPLGVNCFSIQPTFSDSFDGVVGLGITGGTPPYTILWETGSIAPAIFNLGVGEYNAIVTDYYGDFTATTTCVLTAITTTTTTIYPITTQKIYGEFCLIKTKTTEGGLQESFYDLTYDGFYNGYPSWVSNPSGLFVYWSGDSINSWVISGITNVTILNNNYNEPTTGEPLPYNNWQVLGLEDTKQQLGIRIVPGSCSSVNYPSISVNKNNPICECDGSISILVNNGTPPYQYSIDGGLSYQSTPVYQGLCSGNYVVFVKDSNDFVDSTLVSLLNTPIVPLTLGLVYTGPNSFEIILSPQPAPGVLITFSLTHSNSFTKQPASSTQTYDNVVTLTKNSIVIPESTGPIITTTNLVIFGPCSSAGKLKTETTTTWNNITIGAGDIINGTFTNSVSTLTPTPECYVKPINNSNLYVNLEKVDSCINEYVDVKNPPIYGGGGEIGPF